MTWKNFGACLCLLLAACTSHEVKRSLIGDVCATPIELGAANAEHLDATPELDPQACALQFHRPPGADDAFALSFIELNERTNELSQPEQFERLLSRLNEPGQHYVITYVHGWRHDASIGNLDVRKFRTLLSYANSFLRHRCDTHRRYCGARLTGIYLGWRGRSFAEPTDRSSNYWAVGAAATFWSRKALSERHAGTALATLQRVAAKLSLDPGNPQADKFLVMGHSFGGNMLATAVGPRIEAMIQSHEPGTEMLPVLGDLVLLINPAAEAYKWTDLQSVFHSRTKANTDTEKERFFGRYQRPFYLSVTSNCDWNSLENPLENSECDDATSFLFPYGQMWPLNQNRKSFTTIGHYDPVYDGRQPREMLGTSHELVVNNTNGESTTYSNGAKAEASVCNVVDGWLTKARARVVGGKGWDSDYGPDGRRSSLTAIDSKGRHQIRHGLSLRAGNNRVLPSIVPGNFPLWNIRSGAMSIPGHGAFANYPVWCALNQLVLDDVSRPVSR